MDPLLQFLTQGGPFMAVIGAAFFVALAIVIERVHFYQVVCRADGDALAVRAIESVERGHGRRAIESLGEGSAPIHALLGVALEGHLQGHTFAHIEEAVEETAVRQVARLHRRVDYLAVIANVATLAGLLGTIFGLKESFTSLSVADASAKAALLAAGISQAMNTTALGLVVAIPCMIAHAKLTARRNQLLVDLDSGTLRLLNRLRRHSAGHPVLLAESRSDCGDSSRQGRSRESGQVERGVSETVR